jgi:hypothetical protein
MYSKVFRILLTAEVILLFVQFWLGMSINLFVLLPPNSAQNFAGYSGGTEVLTHIISGVLILALAGLILSYGFRLKSSFITILSVLALVFASVAVSTGATFALRLRDDSLSMAMAMSFLIVFIIYFSEFYLVGKTNASTVCKNNDS